LKRSSNRLVLLVGLFLAVVAFVLIAVMFSNGGPGGGANGPSAAPATVKVVVAATDIPLGSRITADMVTTKDINAADKPLDSYPDTSLVIGQTARQQVTAQQLITSAILNGGGSISNITVPAGYVGIAVQVDQVSGVGTLIKPGDRVDVVTGFAGGPFPEVYFGSRESPTPAPRGSAAPTGSGFPILPGDNYVPVTVKTVVEGLQVLGTLLPPAAQATPSGEPGAGTNNGTSLDPNRSEIVIVAATSQQAEAIRFVQVGGGSIALVLRSSTDCTKPDGTAANCPIVPTTGITLRKMVDDFGVLPPQIVEVLEPTPYPSPMPVRQYPSPSPIPSPSASGSTTP
jgi:Flp pilus assembly protein CpaB